MTMQAGQFTLRRLFAGLTIFGIILGLAVAVSRWANDMIMEVERDAARARVLERGSDSEYDRRLLGDEVDSLKSEFERRKSATK